METLVKADIFFFIASIATVIITILVAVVLYYFIKAGRTLHKLASALEERYADTEEFVVELRERLEDNPIFRYFFPRSRKRKQAREKEKKEE